MIVPFLTTRELAAYLGVRISWVHAQTRLSGSEVIPCYAGLGRGLRFNPAEVVAWIEATKRREAGPVDRRRRRVSRSIPESEKGANAGKTRVPNGETAAVALSLPSEPRK